MSYGTGDVITKYAGSEMAAEVIGNVFTARGRRPQDFLRPAIACVKISSIYASDSGPVPICSR
jgi:hypothetical protein